jgi:hypothetical protein
MITWANALFYVVFLGQILLISHIAPTLVSSRFDRLLSEFPPERYPKLYPKPVEVYRMGLTVYKWSNALIGMLGLVVLLGIVTLDHGAASDDSYISEAWPMVYGAIQFLPSVILEVLGFRQFKWMRRANTATTRKADLRPRRLFDHVSPGLLLAALALFAAVIGFDLYLKDFVVDWSSEAIGRDMVLTLANFLLLALGIWHLSGRKQDPYQSTNDRARQIKAQLTSLLLVSMAMSVYFMTQTADDVFNLDYLDASLMSLYFQVIVVVSLGFVLHSLKLEDFDFDVYADHTTMEN